MRFSKRLINTSVKTKVLGITIGLVFLMGMTSIIIVRGLLVINLTHDLEKRAISIANDLSLRGIDFTILQDIYNLDRLLKQTNMNHPDIEYMFILDYQKQPVIHSFGPKYDVAPELMALNMPGEGEDYHLLSFESESGTIHDVVTPMLDGDVGYVRVGLNENHINNTINKLTFTLIISTTVIGLLGFIISYMLTKIMYRDLTKLIHVSSEVGKGNLDSKVAIASNDEIGLLGKEFNTMISRLKNKNDENMQYLQQLELRNKELFLLNELSNTFLDVYSLQKHLQYITKQLKEEQNLFGCFIEMKINDKLIHASHAVKHCSYSTQVEKRKVCISREFPISSQKEVIGKLAVCFKDTPSTITIKFLHSFSRQLSVIAENVELWQELKYKEELRLKLLDKVITAQEEERKRIARELHDETSQSLTSIILGLSMLEEEETSGSTKEKLAELKEITETTIEEVHYISWSLRPSALDDYGLLPAIKNYAIDFKKKYDIDVDIEVIGFDNIRLPSTVEVTIYRVIQEALTNAARHANAENISIIIKHVGNVVSLIIEDDGSGFDVSAILNKKLTKDHLGLKGMQERIESIGSKFFIESNPGFGTSIYVTNIEIGSDIIES